MTPGRRPRASLRSAAVSIIWALAFAWANGYSGCRHGDFCRRARTHSSRGQSTCRAGFAGHEHWLWDDVAELSEMPKRHDYLIGVKSDGAGFDTMKTEQKEAQR